MWCRLKMEAHILKSEKVQRWPHRTYQLKKKYICADQIDRAFMSACKNTHHKQTL